MRKRPLPGCFDTYAVPAYLHASIDEVSISIVNRYIWWERDGVQDDHEL